MHIVKNLVYILGIMVLQYNLTGSVAAIETSPVKGNKITVSNIVLSSRTLTTVDQLNVSCDVNGMKGQTDWCTVLVYEGGNTNIDRKKMQYIARSNPRVVRFKGKPGDVLYFRGKVDLSGCFDGNTYTAYLYGQIPEFLFCLGTFTIDNAVLASRALPNPVMQDNLSEPLLPLGLTVLQEGRSLFYPYNAKSHRLIAEMHTSDAKIEALFQITNHTKKKWAGYIDARITDIYWRGEQTRVDVTISPGETRLIRLPVSRRQIERFAETRVWSMENGGIFSARLFVGNKVDNTLKLIGTTGGRIFILSSIKPQPRILTRVIPKGIPRTKIDPVWGRLTLVDIVDCANETPYQQGGKGLYAKYSSEPLMDYNKDGILSFGWQSTYFDTTHENGFSEVHDILGKPCRVTDNWGWFAYELGHGKIKQGDHYLLEVEYPEDEPRTFVIYNNNPSNPGFHTGNTLGDPWTRQRFMCTSKMPLSKTYKVWQGFSTGKPNYYVSIHSTGDIAAPFSHGAAVRTLRLYKIETPMSRLPFPAINYPPAPLPRRQLILLQEDAAPFGANYMHELRNYGINTYAPVALHYSGKGTGEANTGRIYWQSKLFDPERYNIVPPPTQLDKCLADAQKVGMDILLTFEYGGTSRLTEDAIAIKPDGSKYKYIFGAKKNAAGKCVMRWINDWYCIDIAHPAVAEDFGLIMDEFRTVFLKYPNIKGVELTHRFNAWQISFSNYELNRFAKETGVKIPDGSQADRAKWVIENALDKYYHFFYEKKREVMLSIRDHLQSIRPDLKLHVLNYVSDDHLPFGSILQKWTEPKGKQIDEFLKTPGKVCLPEFNDNILSLPDQNVQLDLRVLLEDYRRNDQLQPGIYPPLYRNDKGIALWAPVHYEYTANSSTYLDFFRTGEGVSVADFWIYNEDCLNNNKMARVPGLQGTEHAGPFCMMEEVMTTALVDPPRIGIRMGYFRRGFPKYSRAFSCAYLALPALPSKVVDTGIKDTDIVVRKIETNMGIYYAIINRGFDLTGKNLRLKCFAKNTKLKDLVSGKVITSNNGVWEIIMSPMQLRSFIAE